MCMSMSIYVHPAHKCAHAHARAHGHAHGLAFTCACCTSRLRTLAHDRFPLLSYRVSFLLRRRTSPYALGIPNRPLPPPVTAGPSDTSDGTRDPVDATRELVRAGRLNPQPCACGAPTPRVDCPFTLSAWVRVSPAVASTRRPRSARASAL